MIYKNLMDQLEYLCFFIIHHKPIEYHIHILLQDEVYGIILKNIIENNGYQFNQLPFLTRTFLSSIQNNLYEIDYWQFIYFIIQKEKQLTQQKYKLIITAGFSLFLLMIIFIIYIFFLKRNGIFLLIIINSFIILGLYIFYHNHRNKFFNKIKLLLLFFKINNNESLLDMDQINDFYKIQNLLYQGHPLIKIINIFFPINNISNKENLKSWIFFEIQWQLNNFYNFLENYWLIFYQLIILMILMSAFSLVFSIMMDVYQLKV